MERVAEHGDVEAVRPWASVSKLAVAMAFGVEMDWGLHSLHRDGGTSAERTSPTCCRTRVDSDSKKATRSCPWRTKRVYSNYGVELRGVAAIVGENPAVRVADDRVFVPLGMDLDVVDRSAGGGVSGSTEDLATLAVAWLRPT